MKNYLKLFLAISSIHIFLLLFGYDHLAVFSKPLLLPCLMMAVFSAPTFNTKKGLLSALSFSWIGDVLLIFTELAELFFILGLVSFLISHVFYIVLFFKQDASKPMKKGVFAIGALLVALYLGSFLSVIIPYLGEHKIPVIVYGTVISIMLVTAIRGTLVWKSNANLLILLGAIAFVASDSLLAFNKFYAPYACASSLIMITYLVAQYSITRGVLRLNGN